MNKWKHFFIFSSISVLLIIIQNLIGRNANPGDVMMQVLNIVAIVEIPLIMIILIRTYKNKERLSFKHKFFFLLGIVIVMLVFTIIINTINPFGRRIFIEDIKSGIVTTLIYSVIMLIICLPVIGFVKSKLLTKDIKK